MDCSKKETKDVRLVVVDIVRLTGQLLHPGSMSLNVLGWPVTGSIDLLAWLGQSFRSSFRPSDKQKSLPSFIFLLCICFERRGIKREKSREESVVVIVGPVGLNNKKNDRFLFKKKKSKSNWWMTYSFHLVCPPWLAGKERKWLVNRDKNRPTASNVSSYRRFPVLFKAMAGFISHSSVFSCRQKSESSWISRYTKGLTKYVLRSRV